MKVLVLTNMYPSPEQPWFGAFVHEQVVDLRALGLDVHVLHFDGRRDALNYFRAGGRLRRVTRRERFDLVHAHYGLSGAVALVQHRVPVVTTLHGSDTGYVRWQGYVSWLVARRTTPVFVSESGAKQLGCLSAPIIPAGVDTELFVPSERAQARRALGWDRAGRYVLLPGARRNPVKRADLFDAAVREASQTVGELKPVSLEGFSRQEVALVMNAVDVTLVTSDSEGSPVAVRESLACMTPVVSVPVGDVPAVVAGLPGCAIAPREPRALARGLLGALQADRHPALRRRAERSSRRRIAERVVALYESVVRTHAG